MRAGGNQQLVVGARTAVGERNLFVLGIDLVNTLLHQLDVLRLVMCLRIAQVTTRFFDVIAQKIRNRHTRVRGFGLISDNRDRGFRVGFAKGFRRDYTCGPGTYDDMLHNLSAL